MDNVKEIYPSIDNGSKVYLDLSSVTPNNSTFNISFGHGSHLPATKNIENGIIFFNTTGSPISYHSGNPSGRSVRLDIVPSGGIWADESRSKSWKDIPKPDFLYDEHGFKNHETTFYIRPHNELGTHQACSFKMQGKDNDNGRSVIEMLYPDKSHKKVEVNVNYEHFPYVNYKDVKQYFDSRLQDGKWVGLKVVYIVADDNNSVSMSMYVDESPFQKDGSPTNDWKLLAESKFIGVPEYNNIIPSWAGRKNYLRVDGFESVDFTLCSAREIDTTATPSNGNTHPTPNPNPTTDIVSELTAVFQTAIAGLEGDIKQILAIVSNTNPGPNPPSPPTPTPVPDGEYDDSGPSQNT